MTQRNQASRFLDAAGRPLPGSPDVIRPGTSAVIFNKDGEVLLEKRADYDLWGLPGGGVNAGESVEDAVTREVLEETGLEVKVKRLIGVYSDPRYYSIVSYPNGDTVQYVTASFECERQAGELHISSESTDIGYFSPRALPDDTLLAHRVRIQDALANRDAPFIR